MFCRQFPSFMASIYPRVEGRYTHSHISRHGVYLTDSLHQLADWLESYAHSLELNVWTSATVVQATQDSSSHYWTVTVKLADGRERFLHPRHLIFAIGIGGGFPNMPAYPGMDEFGGQILHSAEHGKATDHEGKKDVVIGSNTSSKQYPQIIVSRGNELSICK